MEKIQTVIQIIFRGSSSEGVFMRLLLTLLTLILLLLIIKFINKLFQKALKKLESCVGTCLPPFKIQNLELISADRLSNILKRLLNALRLLIIALTVYIFIPLVLSFFPQTRGIVLTYLYYIIAPISNIFQGLLAFIPNLIIIAFISLLARYLIKFFRMVFTEIRRNNVRLAGFYPEWAEPTYKLLRFLIIILTIVVISPYLPGFGSPAFQGISIFLGVLLSLGSTAAVANIVAGASLIYMRPFKIGDRVKIADTVGDVIEKTLLITRLRTIKNVEVTIPNSMVLGCHIINFSAMAEQMGLILSTTVTIGYDVPWRTVHQLLTDAALSTQDVSEDPPPFVLQTSLNDFSVTYELNAYTKVINRLAKTQSELHQNIQDKFNAAGVEILSPTYSAIRDGNLAALPEEYLPKTTAPRGFRVLQPENILGTVIKTG